MIDHDSVFDSWIWKRKNKNAFIVWSYLVHNLKPYEQQGLKVTVKPGLVSTTCQQIEGSCRLSRQQVRTAISHLECPPDGTESVIVYRSSPDGLMILMIGWEERLMEMNRARMRCIECIQEARP